MRPEPKLSSRSPGPSRFALVVRIGAVMLTSKEYVQQAEECLRLANATSDVYVRAALTELAYDFKAMAKALEQRKEWLDGKCDGMKTIAGLT